MGGRASRARLYAASGVLAALVVVACGGGGGAVSVPDAPTNVTATPGPGYVKVEWTHGGDGVESFQVHRDGGMAPQQAGEAEPYATVGADERSFLDRDVGLGQGYRYSVVAAGSGGTSSAAQQSGQDAVVEPGVDMVLGRWTGLPVPTTNIGFYLFLEPADWPEAGQENVVTVEGPGGWSEAFELDRSAFETGFTVVEVPTLLQAGEYTLSVPVGGTTHTASAEFDNLTDWIPLPTNVQFTDVTLDTLDVSWDAVPGASSYVTEVFGRDELPLGLRFVTGQPASHASGLEQEPGGYYLQVSAYAWDVEALEAGQVPEKPDTVGASRSAWYSFAVPDPGACPDPDALVEVPDAALRAAISDQLGLAGSDLTCFDMQKLSLVRARGVGVSSLDGLQHATNLLALVLAQNEITDLAPIAGLTGLRELYAHDNPITSLEPLAGLTNLGYLEVSDNDVASLEPLAGLDQLVWLGAARMPNVTDLSPLEGRSLTYLWLNGSSGIEDFSPIAGMTSLTSLLVGGTQFDDEDLTMVASFPALGRLQLWANAGISDLSPIADLPIWDLDIGATSVTDLSPIHSWSESLQSLRAYGLGLGDSDIAFLEDFTDLSLLWLDDNVLTDIAPLVANAGIGQGDVVQIQGNCLDLGPESAASEQIDDLVGRGVEVTFEPQGTC